MIIRRFSPCLSAPRTGFVGEASTPPPPCPGRPGKPRNPPPPPPPHSRGQRKQELLDGEKGHCVLLILILRIIISITKMKTALAVDTGDGNPSHKKPSTKDTGVVIGPRLLRARLERERRKAAARENAFASSPSPSPSSASSPRFEAQGENGGASSNEGEVPAAGGSPGYVRHLASGKKGIDFASEHVSNPARAAVSPPPVVTPADSPFQSDKMAPESISRERCGGDGGVGVGESRKRPRDGASTSSGDGVSIFTSRRKRSSNGGGGVFNPGYVSSLKVSGSVGTTTTGESASTAAGRAAPTGISLPVGEEPKGVRAACHEIRAPAAAAAAAVTVKEELSLGKPFCSPDDCGRLPPRLLPNANDDDDDDGYSQQITFHTKWKWSRNGVLIPSYEPRCSDGSFLWDDQPALFDKISKESRAEESPGFDGGIVRDGEDGTSGHLVDKKEPFLELIPPPPRLPGVSHRQR